MRLVRASQKMESAHEAAKKYPCRALASMPLARLASIAYRRVSMQFNRLPKYRTADDGSSNDSKLFSK